MTYLAPPATPPSHNNQGADGHLRHLLTYFLAAGLAVQIMSPHHLKHGPWNYYPKRGIIHRDGAIASEPLRGPDAFIECCGREVHIPQF